MGYTLIILKIYKKVNIFWTNLKFCDKIINMGYFWYKLCTLFLLEVRDSEVRGQKCFRRVYALSNYNFRSMGFLV